MKKLLLSAFAAFAMATGAMAADWTTYVNANDASAITTAINEKMSAGDRHTVVLCKKVNATNDGVEEEADGTCSASLGKSLSMQAVGTLIIKSNAKDIDDLPQLYLTFAKFPVINAADGLPSLVFENLNLDDNAAAGGGGYIFSHKTNDNTFGMDSCVFRRCSIKSGRAIFREENTGGTSLEDAQKFTNYFQVKEGSYATPHTIKKFVFEKNKCHEMDLDAGNNWQPFYFVSIPEEIYMFDNMFYDMPYAKQFIAFHKTAVSENQAANWYIYNNTFLMSSMSADAGVTATKKFTLINAGSLVSSQTNFQIYNNLFLGQTAGLYAIPKGAAETDVWVPMPADGQKNGAILVNCIDADGEPAGYITAKGNYFSEYYEDPQRYYKAAEGEEPNPYAYDLFKSNCDGLVWTNEKFRGAEQSKFNVLSSDEFYTAGASYVEDVNGNPIFNIPTYVGAGIMYVDEFVQEAEVKVEFAGETFGKPSYTVKPQKEIYKVGDEVTVAVTNPAATALNQFDKFLGWYQDGVLVSEEQEMTLTFEEAKTYNLTAKFEKNAEFSNILAAWYSSTGKDMQDIPAEIGAGMLMGVGTDTLGLGEDPALQEAALPYVPKVFQTRTNKFGEDPAEAQVCTYNLRTPACARNYNRDYALIKLNTKGKVDVVATFYRGTDSNASKMQYTYWSTDSVNWTKIDAADLDLSTVSREAKFSDESNGHLFGWAKVTAALPAECNNQESVFVKIQGAVKEGEETEDDIVFNDFSFADAEIAMLSDVFEYITNIVVTANNFDLSKIDNVIQVAKDTLDNTVNPLVDTEARAYLGAAIVKAEEAKPTVADQAGIDAVVNELNAAIKEAFNIQLLNSLVAFTDGEAFIVDEYSNAGTTDMGNNEVYGGKVVALGGSFGCSSSKGSSVINGVTYKNSIRLKNSNRVFMFKVAKDSEITIYGQAHSTRVFCAGTELGKADLGKGQKNVATFTFKAPAGKAIYVSSVDLKDGDDSLAGGDLYVAGFTVKNTTAVNGVKVDENNAKVGKFVKKNSIVIVNGKKLYNVAGAQLK